MSDREPRKRKKRRDAQKKEDLNTEEVTFSSKKLNDECQKDSEPETEEEVVPHEPSAVARIIFFVVFSLLIVATGVVFFALHGADRSVDITDTEVSHPEELIAHELPVPFTEEWKPEESSKEVIEESEMWSDVAETKQDSHSDIMQEEPDIPSDEILDHMEYYTQMPFEDITELPESEETEMFDRNEETSEKEFVESYTDDDQQNYYEDDIDIFPVTENGVDYEPVVSEEHVLETIDAEEAEEPLVQIINEQPIPVVESSLGSEELKSTPSHVQTEEEVDISKEQLRTLPETTDRSQAEPSENQNIEANTESSEALKQDEMESSKQEEYENADITNEEDYHIKDELDEIDRIIDKEPGEDDIYFWF